jgi:DNA modification methylase
LIPLRDYKSLFVRDLIKYKGNSRTHSDEQIAKIVRSINEFGFTNPLLVDENNVIIAGHGRLAAAIVMGMDELPCIVLNGLSDPQKSALVIADNKIALDAGWDLDLLTSQFNYLKEFDYDLTLTGFGLEELCDIFPTEEPEVFCDEDDCPDVSEDTVAKLGDVWLLGEHRLMCGDSTSIAAVDKLMNSVKADMVFTDPPYGFEYQSNMRTKSKKFDVLVNDDSFLDIAPIIECASKGWVFIWTSWKVQNKWIGQFESFDYPTNMVVWHKPGGGIGDLKKTFSSDYEVALVWHRGADLCGKRIGSVWTISKDGATTYRHPTQKPVALAEEALDKCTKQHANVLDLFGGSGSTLIACEKLKRKCFMMELDPKYCDVIIKRYENYTGKKAILEINNVSS